MFRRYKKSITFTSILVALVVATAGNAYTAPVGKSGAGTAGVSGYEVSGIQYATSGATVTAVSFVLDSAATHVSVKLSTASGWHNCGHSQGPTHAVHCDGLSVDLAAIAGVTVVANR